ncbi:MAG TPA: ABC transporter substrate-binding protein [Chloroflexia bacterium]|nr:ABC transporter substrate-binding protein [Chloroflexia bacterium]
MPLKNNIRRLSRRKFLATSTLSAFGLAAYPGLSASPGISGKANILFDKTLNNSPALSAPLAINSGSELKLGVLTTRSIIYPEMSNSLLAGMQLYFDLFEPAPGGRNLQLVAQENGGSYTRSRSNVSKLLVETGGALLAGITNPANLSTRYSDVVAQQKALFLAGSSGENVSRDGDTSANLVHSSLMSWQSAWTIGNWAAAKFGKKALVMSSFYESGYDALYAFQLGFESAGGQVVKTVITGSPSNPAVSTEAALLDAVKETRPDVVYAAYSGSEALEFVKAYSQSGLGKDLPLLGSPFLTDETWLAQQGDNALNIYSVHPWSAALDSAQNKAFISAYRDRYGKLPDTFAVLGFEKARLIAGGLNAASGDPARTSLFRDGLLEAGSANSFKADSLLGSLYLRQVQKTPDGEYANVVLASPGKAPGQEVLPAAWLSSPKTGWSHPYLGL